MQKVAKAQPVGRGPRLYDIETVLLQKQLHGAGAVEIAVFNIHDRASLPKYPRGQRSDLVIEADQHATLAKRSADLIEKGAGFWQMVEHLEHARRIELAGIE